MALWGGFVAWLAAVGHHGLALPLAVFALAAAMLVAHLLLPMSRTAWDVAEWGWLVVAPRYCLSYGVATSRFSGAYRNLCRKHAVRRAIPATLISALGGWWGVPWGLVLGLLLCPAMMLVPAIPYLEELAAR